MIRLSGASATGSAASGDRRRDWGLMLAALAGILAPIGFAVVITVLGFLQPGYSLTSQIISELGTVEAPNARVEQVTFVLVGALLLAFTIGLHRGIASGRGSHLGPALLAGFAALALMGTAALPCDPRCVFKTLVGILHAVTAGLGFVAFIAATFVFARRMTLDDCWRTFRTYSLGLGILASLLLILLIVSPSSLDGLFQRVFVGSMFVWLEIMAVRLFWLAATARI